MLQPQVVYFTIMFVMLCLIMGINFFTFIMQKQIFSPPEHYLQPSITHLQKNKQTKHVKQSKTTCDSGNAVLEKNIMQDTFEQSYVWVQCGWQGTLNKMMNKVIHRFVGNKAYSTVYHQHYKNTTRNKFPQIYLHANINIKYKQPKTSVNTRCWITNFRSTNHVYWGRVSSDFIKQYTLSIFCIIKNFEQNENKKYTNANHMWSMNKNKIRNSEFFSKL